LPPDPRSCAAGADGAAGLASTAGSDSAAPDAKTPLAAAIESFPLSRSLLEAVLADRLSDRFVCGLVWTRLGYGPSLAAVAPAAALEAAESAPWSAGPTTPPAWAEAFPEAPELIASRPASVRLTRSIAAPHKQLLKQQLGFGGYRIGELYPRRTRRATAVNWLLAHLAERGEALPDTGPLPPLLEPPLDPVQGHPGDLAVG
jgi:hypothetical protein